MKRVSQKTGSRTAQVGVSAPSGADPAGVSTAPRMVLVAIWMGSTLGAETMDGIHRWIREHGANWRIRFADTKNYFVTSLRWMIRQRRLDGVITFYRDKSCVSEIRDARIPLVQEGELVGYDDMPEFAGSPLIGRVSLDVEAVARVAADHLLSRAGFRAAGYVENFYEGGWSRRRGDAIVAEFERRGVDVRRFLHHGGFHDGRENLGPDLDGLAEWLRDIPKPAAIVAANDATADEIIRICEADGIAVPRDVAVLGMDDNPILCWHSDPNISSIHFDGRRAGYLAAGMLASMMDGAPAPARDHVLYGVDRLVARGSTATPSSIGEIVQKALDYIDANACSGATLADVVRHCHYSRTLVTRRFRQMTGRSVEEALRKRRLDEACRLLRETSLSGEEIAPRCGYDSPCALRRAFRRELGLTMSAWRAGTEVRKTAGSRISPRSAFHTSTP